MTRRYFLRTLCLSAFALVCALGVGGCASDVDRVKDVVASLLESYVVPVPGENGNEPRDASWPAADFGDAATMEVLSGYGVDADEWHRHCFRHFSFEVGDATVDEPGHHDGGRPAHQGRRRLGHQRLGQRELLLGALRWL